MTKGKHVCHLACLVAVHAMAPKLHLLRWCRRLYISTVEVQDYLTQMSPHYRLYLL